MISQSFILKIKILKALNIGKVIKEKGIKAQLCYIEKYLSWNNSIFINYLLHEILLIISFSLKFLNTGNKVIISTKF